MEKEKKPFDQSGSLDNVVRKIQLIILKKLNPTIGEPDKDQVVPYMMTIKFLNDEFKTNYQVTKLWSLKVEYFYDIYKKLPLKDNETL